MKNLYKKMKKVKVKGSIFFSTIALAAIVFGSISVRMFKNAYSMIQPEPSGIEIITPSKVILGSPSGWEQYQGATIWNWDYFKIEINNPTEYPMTNISISLTGTGQTTGTSGGTEDFHIDSLPSSVAAGQTATARGYGVIKNAYNYQDTDETISISYQLNGQAYTTSRGIHFYSLTKSLNNLSQPEAIPGEFAYRYKNGTNEDFYVKIARTNIYMDKSETLDDFNISVTYKSAFGNQVKVEHPQSESTDGYFAGSQPRLKDYLGMDSKPGSGSYKGITTKTADYQDIDHILRGKPKTTTNGETVIVKVPVRGHYIKSGFGGYDYKTNDSQFEVISEPIVNLTIYDKSYLAAAINNLQGAIDSHDPDYYNIPSGLDAHIAEALTIYNTRVVSQSEIDSQTQVLTDDLAIGFTEKDADYSALNSALSAINPDVYTDDSWALFSATYNEASAINTNKPYKKTRQSLIDAEVTKLNNAITVLVYKLADYSGLEAKIAEAQAIDANASQYKKDSYWTTFQNKYSAAQTELSEKNYNIMHQTEVDTITNQLDAAIQALNYEDANYDKINEYIQTYNEEIKESNIYSDDYKADIADAIAAVTWGLDIREQALIDSQAAVIENLLNNPVYAPADYTAVNNAIAAAELITNAKVTIRGNEENVYTSDTINAINEAVDAVVWNMTRENDGQATVDGFATAINTAITNKVERGAIYQWVQDAIAMVTDKKDTKVQTKTGEKYLYQQSARDAVDAAIAEVVTGKKITEQSDVDAWEAAIIQASDNLDNAINPADYSEVNAIIDSFHSSAEYINNWYISDQVSAVDTYIAQISTEQESAQKKKITEQSDVDEYATTLETMIDNLELKLADYSGIESKIETLETSEAYQNEWYTDATIMAVKNFINTYDEQITINRQSEVDALESQLDGLIAALEYKLADYSILDEAINSFFNSEAYQKGWYVDTTSVDEYIYNYQHSEKTITINHQDDVTAMVNELQTKIGNLQMKPASYEQGNTEKAKSESAKAETYKGQQLYTDESIQKLEAAISEYNALLNLDISHQDDIDKAVEKMINARKGLVKNPADYSQINELVEKINKLNKNDYKNFDKVEDQLNNIIYGKGIDEQDVVDYMYEMLLKAYDSLEKKPASKQEESKSDAKKSQAVTITSITVNGNEVNLANEPYQHTVIAPISKVDIKVMLSDGSDNYEIEGNNNLTAGDNEFTIKVGNERYKLIITRTTSSNYLKSLKINEANIKFKRKKQTYKIKVKETVYSLGIKAIPEDELAKVKIVGNKELTDEAKVKIIVTGQDDRERTYIIEITKPDVKEGKKTDIIPIIALGGTASLLICIGLYMRKKYQ